MLHSISRQRRASSEEAQLHSSSRGNSAGSTIDRYSKRCGTFDDEVVHRLTLAERGFTSLSGLSTFTNLTCLLLPGNCISSCRGLDVLPQLTRLDLSCNQIASLEDLAVAALPRLQHLHLQGNSLATVGSLALQLLALLPVLASLYLQDLNRSRPNPVCHLGGYKAVVLAALPGLGNLDGERSARTSTYAELSAEMEELLVHPPAPRQVQLPDIVPWIDGDVEGSESIPRCSTTGSSIPSVREENDVRNTQLGREKEGNSQGGSTGGVAAAAAEGVALSQRDADALRRLLRGRDEALVKRIDRCRVLQKVLVNETQHLAQSSKVA